MPKRSVIYVDGFNLYYGALRGSKSKWLNLESFFTKLRQDDVIQNVMYFTAPVSGSEGQRQDAYLRALATLPLVRVVLGRFKTKPVTCGVRACTHHGDKVFQVPEEKRTDVNIATTILDDAYQGRMERIVLVSGDSDLAPALLMVKTRFPTIERIVYVPATNEIRGAAVELRSVADKDKTLPLALLKKCQFSQHVSDGSGGVISKPDTW